MPLPAAWLAAFEHRLLDQGPVLDLGMGRGEIALGLARKGREVIGVELDELAARRVRTTAESEGLALEVRRQDARSLQLEEGSLAGAVLANVLPFLPKSAGRSLLNQIIGSLQPGAPLLVVTFSPDDPARTAMLREGEPVPDEPSTYLDEQGQMFTFTSADELKAFAEGTSTELCFEVLLEDDHPPTGRHLHGQSVFLGCRLQEGQGLPASTTGTSRIPGPDLAVLPSLGVGLSLRRTFEEELLSARERVDLLEVITEELLLEEPSSRLGGFLPDTPVLPHGVTLNLGANGPRSEHHLDEVARVLAAVDAPWHSDHLCACATSAADTASLVPLPFDEASIERIAHHVRRARAVLRPPLLVENITAYYRLGGPLEEPEFLNRICREADVGLLLDLCNLEINAANHGFDVYAFLEALDLERVVQIHLAGETMVGQTHVDLHAQPVAASTWQLLEFVLQRAPVKAVVVERDQNMPPLADLLEEVDQARKLFQRFRGTS